MTDEIEQNLQNNLEREISTGMVGEQVMDKLRDVDEVAYVRFASVYRQFKDIHTFMAELARHSRRRRMLLPSSAGRLSTTLLSL